MRATIRAVCVACVMAGAWLGLSVASAGAATATTSAAPLPVVYNFPLGLSKASATASPPGANNYSCKPSAAHPYPVVLVPGTFEDMADNFNALSPLLANNGYCVFALNYGSYDGSGAIGVGGIGDIPTSAGQLASFVNQVLSATGASKVDIVGHSQGGMMPRYYLKYLGGQSKVADMIGLAPSNYGTTVDGLFTLSNDLGVTGYFGVGCPACAQQDQGSAFLTKLNAGGDTVSGVTYTVIETNDDEVVTPYTNAFLHGPGVTNELLQSQCSLDHADHLAITYDHIALADVLTALGTPEHPACSPVLPLIGG